MNISFILLRLRQFLILLHPTIVVRQKAPFRRRIHIRSHHPFGVGRLDLVQRAQLDLVQLELESRSDLLHLHLPFHIAIRMMAERNVIVVIREADHSARVLLGHREQILENGHGAIGEFRLEVVEDQVGFLFAHRTDVRHIVAHYDAGQIEVGRRSVWQMAYDQVVGHSAVLVDDDEIGHVVCAASVDQLLHLVVATVHALGIREDESQFFDKHLEASRWVARCGDHDLWVLAASPAILIVLGVGRVCAAAEAGYFGGCIWSW